MRVIDALLVEHSSRGDYFLLFGFYPLTGTLLVFRVLATLAPLSWFTATSIP